MSRRTTNLSQCDRASQNYTPFEGKVRYDQGKRHDPSSIEEHFPWDTFSDEIIIKRFAQVD